MTLRAVPAEGRGEEIMRTILKEIFFYKPEPASRDEPHTGMTHHPPYHHAVLRGIAVGGALLA